MFSRASASERNESPADYMSFDEATKGDIIDHTTHRIKDPKVSVDFYTRVLGMSLLKKLDYPEEKSSLYFMGYNDVAVLPGVPSGITFWRSGQMARIELKHNWGTESDPEFKGYHNGNSDPRGFGHIGITVDDTCKAFERFERLGVEFVKKPDDGHIGITVDDANKAFERFERQGVEFVKKPDDGKMKGVAFIKDPDGYLIEIFDQKTVGK